MSLLLTKLQREGAGARVLSPARLWFDATETRLLPEGHPDAAYLCVPEGGEVPAELPGRFGIKTVCGAMAIKPGETYDLQPLPEVGELVVSAEDQAATIDSLRGQVDSLRAEVAHLSAPGSVGAALVAAEERIAHLEAEVAEGRAALDKLTKKGSGKASQGQAGAQGGAQDSAE